MRGQLEEAEGTRREEERGRGEAEEQCRQLHQKLKTAQEHCASLQSNITALTNEVYTCMWRHADLLY